MVRASPTSCRLDSWSLDSQVGIVAPVSRTSVQRTGGIEFGPIPLALRSLNGAKSRSARLRLPSRQRWREAPCSQSRDPNPDCARRSGSRRQPESRAEGLGCDAVNGSLQGEAGCPRRRRSASDQETRDRAERGSPVRGSARASVVAEEDTPPRPKPRC
jgi:hypothetical protein